MNENVIDIRVIAKNLAEQTLKEVNKQIRGIGDSLKTSATSFLKLSTAVAAGQAIFKSLQNILNGVVGLFNKAKDAAVDFVTESLKLGADLDRVETATRRIISNVQGVSLKEASRQFDDLNKKLEETNTFGINAAETIRSLYQTELIKVNQKTGEYNISIGKTTIGVDKLIKSTKDLAASQGISSSEAIKKVTSALITQRDEQLVSLGITANMAREYQNYSKKLGITSNELTETQKRQVLLNVILREGEKASGVYADTYDTAGKNLLSMQDAMKSLKEVFGSTLQPVFKIATGQALDFIKSIRSFVQDNRQELTQFFQGIADKLSVFMERINSSIGEKLPEILEKGFGFLKSIFEESKPIIQDIIDQSKELFETLQEEGIIDRIVTIGTSLTKALSEELKQTILNILNAIKSLIRFLNSDTGKRVMKNTLTAFENIAKALEKIINLSSRAKSAINNVFSSTSKGNKATGLLGSILGKIPGFANGADFVVPPGFPNDSFPINVQSGERVQVTPAGQTSNDNRKINMNFNLSGDQSDPQAIASMVGFQLNSI